MTIHRHDDLSTNGFKRGDMLRCLDDDHVTETLRVGSIYRIMDIAKNGDGLLFRVDINDEDAPIYFRSQRFEKVEVTLTGEQFSALKSSLETLKAAHPNSWQERHASVPHSSLANFFRDMDMQGLLSDPKPKTAQEIARETLNKVADPVMTESSYAHVHAALKAIANLP